MIKKSTLFLIAVFVVYMLLLATANAQTPLEKLAASMAPGTFAVLNQPGDGSGYDTNLTQSGLGTGGLFTYASKGAYDPVRQRWFFIGSGHNGGDPAESYKIMKFIGYDGPTNKWLTLVNPKFVTDLGNNLANSHGYQLQTVGGNQLFKGWGNTNWMFACFIDKANIADIGGDNCPGDYPDPLATGPAGSTSRGFLESFPDRNSLLWGETAGGELYEKPLNGNWTARLTASDLAGDGHMAAYNSTARIVVFGGGNAGSADFNYHFYKMEVSGAITRIDDVPVGTYAAGSTLFAADPLSSRFILIRPNDFNAPTGYWLYELDTTRPAGSQWQRLQGLESAIPNLNNNHLMSVLATTIPDAGVIMVNTPDKVYLYKHSPGSVTPPPANTAPAVQCPANQSVTLPTPATLTASAKDDGQIGPMVFLWSGSGVTFSSPTAASTAATAPAGTYPVTFMANDGALQSSCTLALTFTGTAPPQPTTGIPSLDDEKATYTRWGWTWTPQQEPSTLTEQPNSTFPNGYVVTVDNVDLHGDTEGDDLWAYLMMYRRTGHAFYLNRAQKWATYYRDSYFGSPAYNIDRNSFGLDHFYGWGLVDWYLHTKDATFLTAAETLAVDLEKMYDPNQTTYSCLPQYSCLHYSLRAAGRQLRFITALAKATGAVRWIALRDKILGNVINSISWDPKHGMYWSGDIALTDQMMGAGSHAAGGRIQTANHVTILAEALFQAYLATGRADIRQRMVDMAHFVERNGIDPTYQYTASIFGVSPLGQPWHVYATQNPVTFWPSAYTTSMVNTLVLGYKFTGEANLLNLAKHYFNRGTKGATGGFDYPARYCTDTVVCHFVDTEFDTSSGGMYLAHNKGELQYTYLLFENGGLPTVEGSQPPPVNAAPTCAVIPNQSVTLPAAATLTASCTDDGLPNKTLTGQWSGQGVTFGSPQSATTTATAPVGTYNIAYVASDGSLSSQARTMTLTVLQAPGQPAPTITLTAAPSIINAGEWTNLTWSSMNATSVTVSTLGSVSLSGSQQLKPTTTTTYVATATGTGGTASSSATVTVAPVIPPTPGDIVGPSVRFKTQNGASFSSNAKLIELTVSDNVGVTQCDPTVNGVKIQATPVFTEGAKLPATVKFYLQQATIPKGTYILGATCWDAAGNVGTAQTISVTRK